KLIFSQPVDPKSVTSSSFSVQAWNYRYSKNYGSPEFKISNPNQQGRDPWLVNSVRLLDQNRALFLEIPELTIADQLAISINVNSQTQRFDTTLYATIKHKRKNSIEPGKPFNSSLAEFEQTLHNGVYVKSHEAIKSSLDFFEPGNPVLEKTQIKNGVDPTRGVSLVTFLKIGAADTILKLKTGKETYGTFRISPLTEKVAIQGAFAGHVKRNSVVEIPVKLDKGYCRIELDLKVTSGDLQSQWHWSSNKFGLEPVPPQALFFAQSWITNKNRKGQFSNRFLEASQLLSDHKCLHCHDLGQASTTAPPGSLNGSLTSVAPNLKSISSRRSREYLFQKISQPHFEENGAEMPSLFNMDNPDHLRKVNDLVAFLVDTELQNPKKDSNQLKPLNGKKVASGEQLFEQLGCIGCHHLPIEDSVDTFERISLKFTKAKFTVAGLIQFLEDPHKYAPYRKMGNFRLTEIEAENLAEFIRAHSHSPIENTPPLTEGDPNRGKELFVENGCANCHQTSHEILPPWYTLSNTESGCLSEADPKNETKIFPRLDLSDDEKQLIGYHINEFKGGPAFTKASIDEAVNSITPWKQSSKLVSSLRCNTCHTMDSRGATLPEIIYEEGVLGLNPERLPNLSQIGTKLHASWMEHLFTGREGTRSRPWLKTRMPSFGAYSSKLAHGFSHRSGFNHKTKSTLKIDLKLAEAGQKLTTPNFGLDCRQCHGVGDRPPRGDEQTQIALGVNFSMATSRLRKQYFDRWMRDPLRIDPQTKMPKYSVDGKSTKITEILGGHADQQFNALWHYLISVGNQESQSR
ncbi:MAG: hypothetical protein VX438_11225, partial [Planctomycetota bacterium]|nr:hypothetical protein [Planctomycetota bacterium]